MSPSRKISRSAQSPKHIVIRGARIHNLKSVDLKIPRNTLSVFSGVSGSGKSSLAFDTLYAEGQRRYIESLSSYARQFLGQMGKPEVDSITGLSPAISIDQKTASVNPRSTVGTITEIYDYMRVLFARLGTPHCPKCGRKIGSQTVDQMADRIHDLPPGTRFSVLAPLVRGKKGTHKDLFARLLKDGYSRVRVNGENYRLEEPPTLAKTRRHEIEVVVDRLALTDQLGTRLVDALETALGLTDDVVRVLTTGGEEIRLGAQHACPDCELSFDPVEPRSFSFNSPFGACESCQGLGVVREPVPDALIADPDLSIREGAIKEIRNWIEGKGHYSLGLNQALAHYDIDLDLPFKKLGAKQKQIIFHGDPETRKASRRLDHFLVPLGDDGIWEAKEWRIGGLVPTIMRRYRATKSDGMRRWYESMMAERPCPDCEAKRLRPESLAVTFRDMNIHALGEMPLRELGPFFDRVKLKGDEADVGEELIIEIRERLMFLLRVGLDYLSLSRPAPTLSGGESQRIRLASQIGRGLTGVLYILDEPSIGLHSRDNRSLLDTLIRLRDLGNTVVVVEHDEETLRSADWVADFGPGAGSLGGEVVASGTPSKVIASRKSLTGGYLSGRIKIPRSDKRRKPGETNLLMRGVTHNNLVGLDLDIPLGLFVAVTGVSGSGKSSLVAETLYPHLSTHFHGAKTVGGKLKRLGGLQHLDKVIEINQKPIGRTPRSNPATYTSVFDEIRTLFSQLPEAKARGYKPGRFSFNVKGGRCEACEGHGQRRIEMHFLPDVWVTCPVCRGLRFDRETREVTYRGRNISDVLDMDVETALAHFHAVPKIRHLLQTLSDVGLGYIKLGQSATTLSGGEAQRIKLAKELARPATGRTLYILDEPTTGLHFHDVAQLLAVLQRLVNAGNSVLVVEHHLDVVAAADWVIDLGPGGGDQGGKLVVAGTPEKVASCKRGFTGSFLKAHL